MLRQRSRPYLFSNSLAPSIVGASLAVLDLLDRTTELRDRLMDNVARFKAGLREAGLEFKDGESAIVPVMLYDAALAQRFADCPAAARNLRDRLFLPSSAQGPSADSCSAFGQPILPNTSTRPLRLLRKWRGSWLARWHGWLVSWLVASS